MVVQDLPDETDVFMEFGHMSAATRIKIEEFRRRRKEAEQYMADCPVGPKRGKVNQEWNLATADSTDETELTEPPPPPARPAQSPPRELPVREKEKTPSLLEDPLERLRNLEARLQEVTAGGRAERAERMQNRPEPPPKPVDATPLPQAVEAPTNEQSNNAPAAEEHSSRGRESPFSRTAQNRPLTFAETSTPKPLTPPAVAPKPASTTISSPTERPATHETSRYRRDSQDASPPPPTREQPRWKIESDMLNLHMNQLLEQAEKGQISMNLVSRIKASPGFYTRPLVKELLEAILLAQQPIPTPPAPPAFSDAPVIEQKIRKDMIVIPIEPPEETGLDPAAEIKARISGDNNDSVCSAAENQNEEDDEEEVDTTDFEVCQVGILK